MEQNCRNLTDIPKQVIRDDGRYIATTYSVFPGITFSFVEAHNHRIVDEDRKLTSDVLEIIYCREGRSEFNLNDEFVFLSSGDLMIVKANTVSHIMNFPIEHYHGITVRIDLDETPHCLSCFLEGINVQPKSLAEKFCSRIGYIARANQAIEHIFSEIYSVSEHIRKGYCKIKTLELMLFLSQLDIESDGLQERVHSRTQVLLAEKIAKYLYERMDDRITLEQLSEVFHVSAAYIQNTFKSVYDIPVGAYVRTIKMESAAYMLEYTDKTILEIAMEHGYDNPVSQAGRLPVDRIRSSGCLFPFLSIFSFAPVDIPARFRYTLLVVDVSLTATSYNKNSEQATPFPGSCSPFLFLGPLCNSTSCSRIGHVDGESMEDVTLQIYLDGKLAGEYLIPAEGLPQEYTLDLKNALSMKISGKGWLHYSGMAEITVE